MEKIKIYLYSLLYSFGVLFSLTFIVSIFYYFNWISSPIVNFLKLLIPILSCMVGGLYLGKRVQKRGYLEGILVGFIFIFVLFLFAILALREQLQLRMILYYIILIFTTMFGSMIGINRKERAMK